jgi:hypothetical protein
MGAIDTNYTFTATDVITSTKMNNILDQSTITATAVFNNTLDVASGKLLVKAGGVTANELAANAVTTTAILDANVTSAKLANADFGAFTVASGVATLDDDVVITSKILDANITAAKLSGAQAGSAPVFGARAWVTFDMTRNAAGATDALLTTRFIVGSGNVTSVTKTAAGVATILFATALPNASYAYFGSGRGSSAANEPIVYNTFAGPKSTTQLGVNMTDANGAFTNFPEVTVMIVG